VEFRGALPVGEKVFAVLDASDLFVMPSRQEGLPRAMVEAMARALPCIGSAVGGIPELLDEEDMVVPDSPAALAARILDVCASPARLEKMSDRCLRRAGEFREHLLNTRWSEFFASIRETTKARSECRLHEVEAARI
jgi:glycosyltransferase involved in cell wall biosynthesis